MTGLRVLSDIEEEQVLVIRISENWLLPKTNCLPEINLGEASKLNTIQPCYNYVNFPLSYLH